MVGAQFMPGLLDVNLCKNKQTNKQTYTVRELRNFQLFPQKTVGSILKVLFIVCFCLFLQKLASNEPGIY